MPEEIAYVNEEALERALEWEKRLQAVSSKAEFLFVSVRALPVHKGATPTFNIWVGISKRRDPDTAIAVVKNVFEKEIQSGRYNIHASAVRGVPGAARDTSDENPRPLAS